MWVVAGRQWIEGGVGVQQECIPKATTEYLTLTSPWTRLVFLMDLIVKQFLCVGILKQNLLDAVQLLHRFVLQLTKTCDYRAQVWKHRNSPLRYWVDIPAGSGLYWSVSVALMCATTVVCLAVVQQVMRVSRWVWQLEVMQVFSCLITFCMSQVMTSLIRPANESTLKFYSHQSINQSVFIYTQPNEELTQNKSKLRK